MVFCTGISKDRRFNELFIESILLGMVFRLCFPRDIFFLCGTVAKSLGESCRSGAGAVSLFVNSAPESVRSSGIAGLVVSLRNPR